MKADFSSDLNELIHRKVRKDRKAQPQYGTRMTRMGRIFTDPRKSASSAQSAFHHVCSSLKNAASGASVSAFITPKPCGFSTPRTRMPAGIRGHALQRRDSGRYHPRFFKNVFFQTGLTGSTGYVFNTVHPVILSNLMCQFPAPEQIVKQLDGVR